MPLLDAPAFQLRIEAKDALGILEGILREKHWRGFELANLSLVYVPYWFFNYDVYREEEGHSESFSSQMCLNATTGEMEPLIARVVKEIPLEKSKEITHDVAFTVESPSVQKDEVKKIAPIKIAGQLGIPKSNVTISGITLFYIPIYKIWITLRAGYRRLDLDGMSGSPLNIEEVPERERGFMEVTRDMLEELKTPKGWVDYSKKAFYWGLGVTTGMTQKAMTSVQESSTIRNALKWLFLTRTGRYTLLVLIAAVLLLLVAAKK
ncbi:MAG: hypothetical protein J7L23_03000 [Candidatus Diapherotrites archaeon]|nr:hypothetical protein [Candidatus Diapherotrites archaeon]